MPAPSIGVVCTGNIVCESPLGQPSLEQLFLGEGVFECCTFYTRLVYQTCHCSRHLDLIFVVKGLPGAYQVIQLFQLFMDLRDLRTVHLDTAV